MKNISFRVRNFEKETFLTFNIDNNAELDEELLDFLEDEEPDGIVPVIFEEGEEFDTFSYDITDKIRLRELSSQEINAEMVLMVIRGVTLSMMNMAEYRIPLSYLVLNRQYIYIDSEYRVEFVCIPLEDMKEEVDLTHFLRNFIASLRFDPTEDGDYVAKLLTYINNRDIFNLHNLLSLVEELMENLGIEIPEGGSSEIYGEYQEIDSDEYEAEAFEDNGSSSDESKDIGDILDDIDAADDLEDAEDIQQVMDDLQEAEDVSGDMTKDESAANGDIDGIEADAAQINDDEADAAEDDDMDTDSDEDIDSEASDTENDNFTDEDSGIDDSQDNSSSEDNDGEDESNMEDEIVSVVDDSKDTDEDDTSEESEEAEAGDENEEVEADEDDQAETESDENSASEDNESEDEPTKKKSMFKTRDNSGPVGVVIEDDLDEFLAEKEREDQEANHEESGLKIRKNIKVNRASIVKNTQDELKAEEAEADKDLKSDTDNEQNNVSDAAKDKADNKDNSSGNVESEEKESTSIIGQTIENAANTIKNVTSSVPKVNPYLVRVNTDERIMITKQTFKLGKAGMGVDYTVKGNGAISRVHAIITAKDGDYYIKDNKSTNHTFVNGKVIAEGEDELLTNDCKIMLGDEEFVFKTQ